MRFLGTLFPELTHGRASPLAFAQGSAYEDYAGFVLIHDASLPVPDYVVDSYGPPHMCNVVEDPNEPPLTKSHYSDVQSLANAAQFPIYALVTPLPSGLAIDDINLIQYSTGAYYGGRVQYRLSAGGRDYTAISIFSRRDYAMPFPVWDSDPAEDESPATAKVSYTPTDGIYLDSLNAAYTLHWIESSTLYQVTADRDPYTGPTDLAANLQRVDPV